MVRQKHPLPLIPVLLQPHFATAAAVLGASALGIVAEHMAGPLLAFPIASLVAKMAGEQIARSWP